LANVGQGYHVAVAPGFQTIALATLRASSVQKWSHYENEKKFGGSDAEG